MLTNLGISTYQNIRAVCTPKKPYEVPYEELSQKIQSHLNPKPSVTAERSRFRAHVQVENETVSAFVVALKKLTAYCEFGENLSETAHTV